MEKRLLLPHGNSKKWGQIRTVLFKMINASWEEFIKYWRELDQLGYGYSIDDRQKDISKKYHNKLHTFITKLAIKSEELFNKELEQSYSKSPFVRTFTKEQIASLNALMFFSLIPDLAEEDKDFPRYRNFNNWRKYIIEQWKCLYNYFDGLKVIFESKNDKEIDYKNLDITYLRVTCKDPLKEIIEKNRNKPISPYKIDEHTPIEQLNDCYQLDFANKFLGGGVLSGGLAQEEIRFTISPELIPALLFFEKMDANDAIVLIGTQQFSKCSGYLGTFKCESIKMENLQITENSMLNVVVAIDAINYRLNPRTQITKTLLDREIVKAYAGFNWINLHELTDPNISLKKDVSLEKQSQNKNFQNEETNKGHRPEAEIPYKKNGSNIKEPVSKEPDSKEKEQVHQQKQEGNAWNKEIIKDKKKGTQSQIVESNPNKSVSSKNASSIFQPTGNQKPSHASQSQQPVSKEALINKKSQESDSKKLKNSEATKGPKAKFVKNFSKEFPTDDIPENINYSLIRQTESEIRLENKESHNPPDVSEKDLQLQEKDGKKIGKEFNNKAELQHDIKKMKIATGKWGCGVFKGNEELKFLIQLLASSLAGKEMVYCTFGDKSFTELEKKYMDILTERITCNHFYHCLSNVINEYEKREITNPYKGEIFKDFKNLISMKPNY